MEFSKYGISYTYGVGMLCREGSYSPPRFHMGIDVIADSKKTTATKIKLNGFPDTFERIDIGSDKFPLLLVFDDQGNMWHEYFTGLPVDIVKCDFTSYRHDYYVDQNYSNIYYRNVAAVGIQELNAVQFAGLVSGYSDSKIRRRRLPVSY